MTDSHTIDELCVNTIRTLAMDAVQKANSGHAGAPMALAPVAYTLWQEFLRYDPADPLWHNRDRFVLSAGHASMLLYALLHLSGVRRVKDGKLSNELAVTLQDIENFRQLDSVTPGHPEHGHTTGVETTTGPLGQGCGNSVGMAMASRWLGARFNKPDATIFDFDVYTICSDGDMMEGVSSEAASLAGHLGLSNLCWLYDSNSISIEGHTDLAFDERVSERFAGYGWNVLHVADANNFTELRDALNEFRQTRDRPTLIIVRSIIGYGAPHKQNTAKAHSDALGEEEVRLTKRFYGWPEDAQFLVPDGVPERFAEGLGARGAKASEAWRRTLDDYRKRYPAEAKELDTLWSGGMPEGWEKALPLFPADPKGMASREASGKVLNALAPRIPWLMGGSADLAPSTKTLLEGENAGALERNTPGGRNLHFGVREHGMGAVVNGLGLCGLRAYGATFLTFSDYMRPPIRLASMMRLPIFHVFTHDSIGLGEDGPTHQPVEHLAGLRSIPDLMVLRPGDANEVSEAYRLILGQNDRAVALVLSRQALPTFDRSVYAPASGVAKGAYVLADSSGDGDPDVILMASGSEVHLCVSAFETLKAEGVKVRVVSMPSWDLFEKQDRAYRDAVLPPSVTARVAVEQASPLGWDRYAGLQGTILAMHSFGASAPLKDVLKKFGFTPEKVVEAAREQIARTR